MEITCDKGERIILTDNCGQSFFGLVKSVNRNLGRVVLSEIVQLPDHEPITGYRNFDKNEIVEIKKHEVPRPEAVISEKGEAEAQTEKQIRTLSEAEYNKINHLQNKYQYIRDYDTNFHSAIALLKTCKKIGIYGADASKGRCGRISVLAISTTSKIFIFDILKIGDDALHRGLKEVLESSDITKVVFDCRMLSDCLKHKYLINLKGIRDIEAEDIMIVFSERHMIRKYSRSLEYLIKVYLGVEVDGFNNSNSPWDERPLSPNLIKGLVRHVSFLIPLHEAMEHKYMQKLIDASTIYNTYVRSSDFFEFLHNETKKTLKKEIIKLVIGQIQPRNICDKKKFVMKKDEQLREC